MVEIMIVVCIFSLIAVVAVPNYLKACKTSQQAACIENLRQMASAKETWALEKGRGTGSMPTDQDLFGSNLYLARKPVCPGGGDYTLRAVGALPICSRSALGHLLLDGDGVGTADAIASSQPTVPGQPAATTQPATASTTATTNPGQPPQADDQGQSHRTGPGGDQSQRENK